MELARIETFAKIESADENASGLKVARYLAAAADGDEDAYFDLGVIYSTGSHGVGSDLIEAHKWFNLAASRGHEEAAWCRADRERNRRSPASRSPVAGRRHQARRLSMVLPVLRTVQPFLKGV